MTASSVVRGDGVARSSLSLEFQSADNAASVEAILSAWDDAGYESDRAMQEDIRYSEVLPVERLTIRDSTTIDGLIHMQITSRCAALERTAD